jgi:hypothetical protein
VHKRLRFFPQVVKADSRTPLLAGLWIGTAYAAFKGAITFEEKTMPTDLFYLVLILGVTLWAGRGALAYFNLRGLRLVSCPETAKPTAVEIHASRGAVSRSIGQRELRLKSCSRWSERQECGQECLAQIAAAPDGCLVRAILTGWYKNKSCVYCAKPFGELDWFEHKPALMSPKYVSLDWTEIAPEQLEDVLATHKPVCASCHVAETFRRLYPDLFIDRPAARV